MATIAIQVGLAVAGTILNALFAPTPPPQEGPRLSDLNLPSVSPGNAKNRIWGTVAVGTQMIWTSGIKETKHTEKVKGGKGAMGGKSQKVITYTYSSDCAQAVCEGPVTRFRRIWGNNKVLYSAVLVSGPDAVQVSAAAALARTVAKNADRLSGNFSDDEFGPSNKTKIRAFMTETPISLTKIYAGALKAVIPTTAVVAAWNAFKAHVNAFIPPLSSSGGTHDSKSQMVDLLTAFSAALVELAENMELTVKGTSDAYVDGVATTQATAAVTSAGISGGSGLFAAVARVKAAPKKAENKARYSRINLYTGTENQMPDDVMEAKEGMGKVPAYRGTAYFVLDDLQLADFGQTLPTFKVEVESGDEDGVMQLQEVVESLCLDAGLKAEEFNVLNLPARTIRGFALTRTASARDALELLRNVHQFDVVESNYQVRFVWRYGPLDARIRPEDLATVEYDSDPEVPMEITRQQVDELPRKIVFKYQDPTRDFSMGTAQAKRSVIDNNEVEEAELPMSLLPAEAKEAAEQLLAYKYASRRNYKVKLPLKYAVLDPGDCVLAQTIKNQPERFLRVLQADLGANHIVEMTLTDHVPPVDGIKASAYEQVNIPSAAILTGPVTAHFLDLPALSDTEDDKVPGFYVGFSKITPGFDGGVLFVDTGSGGITPLPGGGSTAGTTQATWEVAASVNTDLPMGRLLQPILANASPYLWDRTSRLILVMSTPNYTPSSVPEVELQRSVKNTIVIGNEIMQFATVVDLGSRLYELSNLIRGKRGTESFIQAHALDDGVLFIEPTNISQYIHSVAVIDIEQDYRAGGSNTDFSTIPDILFTSHARNLMPYAPGHVRRNDMDNDDITLSLLPRVRQLGTWADSVDVVVDQPNEKYEIDIFNGATFKRTLTLDGVRSIVYPLASQVADFGAHVAYGAMTVKAYQIGATVGRGFTNPIVL